MTMRRTAALVVAFAALLVAAGCGGESQDFIQDYNEATEPFPRLGADASKAITDAVAGKPAAQQDLERAVAGMEGVVAELRTLDPPDDAQDELDALVAATEAWIGEIRALGTALRGKDPAKLTTAAQEAITAAQRAQEAEQALRVAVEG